jgi:colanic acid/amylovoran biosynthesis glycosyltransferase
MLRPELLSESLPKSLPDLSPVVPSVLSPAPPSPVRIGYVLKRYPRYSETFIVNEILAHEAAGAELAIFSLYPPSDTHFQDAISRVRAPVTYLASSRPKASDLWTRLLAAQDAGLHVDAFLQAVQPHFEDARVACWALELALAVRAQGLTHLHAHFASGATTVTRLAAKLTGIPYSFTAHAKDIYHESAVDADLRLKLREARTVVTVSDYNHAYLRGHFGAAAKGVTRIYNGLDFARFPYAAPTQRPPEIVAVGRLVEKKGFADLVRACSILRDRGEVFRCRIVGTGELEAELRDQIAALGVSAEVTLLGPRPQRDLAALLQNAAAFAAPCVVGEDGNRDGLPTVLLEAMALGTPCVSTDVTGIPEILEHETTGLSVPQRDPVALADALARLLHDGALRLRLAEEARARLERDFDIHKNAAALREVFVPVLPVLKEGAR